MDSFQSVLSTTTCLILKCTYFPTNTFETLGCPPRWVSLCGRHLGAGYSLLISLKEGVEPLANRCFLCEEGEETVNHLLPHYTKAKVLWMPLGFAPHSERNSFIFAWFLCGQKKAKGVDDSPPRLVLVHLA